MEANKVETKPYELVSDQYKIIQAQLEKLEKLLLDDDFKETNAEQILNDIYERTGISSKTIPPYVFLNIPYKNDNKLLYIIVTKTSNFRAINYLVRKSPNVDRIYNVESQGVTWKLKPAEVTKNHLLNLILKKKKNYLQFLVSVLDLHIFSENEKSKINIDNQTLCKVLLDDNKTVQNLVGLNLALAWYIIESKDEAFNIPEKSVEDFRRILLSFKETWDSYKIACTDQANNIYSFVSDFLKIFQHASSELKFRFITNCLSLYLLAFNNINALDKSYSANDCVLIMKFSAAVALQVAIQAQNERSAFKNFAFLDLEVNDLKASIALFLNLSEKFAEKYKISDLEACFSQLLLLDALIKSVDLNANIKQLKEDISQINSKQFPSVVELFIISRCSKIFERTDKNFIRFEFKSTAKFLKDLDIKSKKLTDLVSLIEDIEKLSDDALNKVKEFILQESAGLENYKPRSLSQSVVGGLKRFSGVFVSGRTSRSNSESTSTKELN